MIERTCPHPIARWADPEYARAREMSLWSEFLEELTGGLPMSERALRRYQPKLSGEPVKAGEPGR